MQMTVDCWDGCGEEFVVEAPSRNTDELVEGVPVSCSHCGHGYIFTVDGDGEPDLMSPDPAALGENISGHDSDRSTHF